MIKFPEGLPRPQPDDYEFTQTNKIMRTPMESGRAMQRIEWDDVPTLLTMSFIFTHAQANLFDVFVKTVGAGWFIFPVYDPLGYDDDRECRFIKSPDKQTPVGVTHWRYSSCVIEIRDKPELPEDWLLAPSFVLHPEIFDIAINREWPLFLPSNLITEDYYELATEDGSLLTEG